jgi:hypothetical protein
MILAIERGGCCISDVLGVRTLAVPIAVFAQIPRVVDGFVDVEIREGQRLISSMRDPFHELPRDTVRGEKRITFHTVALTRGPGFVRKQIGDAAAVHGVAVVHRHGEHKLHPRLAADDELSIAIGRNVIPAPAGESLRRSPLRVQEVHEALRVDVEYENEGFRVGADRQANGLSGLVDASGRVGERQADAVTVGCIGLIRRYRLCGLGKRQGDRGPE